MEEKGAEAEGAKRPHKKNTGPLRSERSACGVGVLFLGQRASGFSGLHLWAIRVLLRARAACLFTPHVFHLPPSF